jgi:hypothetical protein
MKQPRRGTMLLIALLMAASLVSTPCAGGAVEPKLPLRVPDYPPGEQYGDPDIPPWSPRGLVSLPAFKWVLTVRLAPAGTIVVWSSVPSPQAARAQSSRVAKLKAK